MKPFKFGFIIGRFQHIHKGHQFMIDTGLSLCENLLVLVGSSQEKGTIRNPFSVNRRMEWIHKVYEGSGLYVGYVPDTAGEDDHSTEWGDYLLRQIEMWKIVHNIPHELGCMIYGDDEGRDKWFSPTAIEGITQVVLPRQNLPISATQMREFLVRGRFAKWQQNVSERLFGEMQKIKYDLLEVPYYGEMYNALQDVSGIGKDITLKGDSAIAFENKYGVIL